MNRLSIISIVSIFSMSFLLSCTSEEAVQKSTDLMLLYQESEPGIDPYSTRVLLTEQFLRLDEGSDQSNFTLFDREKNIIYTVAHEQKRIMQVKPVKTENTVTHRLEMDANKLDDKELPSIEGKRPVHYQLQVNGHVCSDVYVIKDFNEEVNTAMSEFKRILASIHLGNINNTPAEMLDECFLAHEVKYPSRSMQFGFPILQKDANGATRLLLDYKRDYKASPDLFKLPPDYRMTDMSGASLDIAS